MKALPVKRKLYLGRYAFRLYYIIVIPEPVCQQTNNYLYFCETYNCFYEDAIVHCRRFVPGGDVITVWLCEGSI